MHLVNRPSWLFCVNLIFFEFFWKKLNFFEIISKSVIFQKMFWNWDFAARSWPCQTNYIAPIPANMVSEFYSGRNLGTCSTDVSWRFYNWLSRGHCAIIVVLQVITRGLNGWLRAARCETQNRATVIICVTMHRGSRRECAVVDGKVKTDDWLCCCKLCVFWVFQFL